MKPLTAKQKWTAMVFVVLASIATLSIIVGPFHYISVCDRCGALRRTTDWQLPLTGLTVFTRSIESDTPLSRVLLTNNIVPPHTHHWLFGNGGGNGVLCAIGPGRHIRPAADSKEVARVVSVLHTNGLTAIRDRVLRGVLDPDTSLLFRGLILNVPEELKTAAEFQTWFSEQLDDFNEMITQLKKRQTQTPSTSPP